MNIILIYDITNGNCNKIKKVCDRYLNRVQNSVFEGDITESKLKMLNKNLSDIINKEEDSVIIYAINNPRWITKEIIGIEKNEIDNFI